jgi:hypothetical protein
MRLDQMSGWALLGVQMIALVVVTTTLWAVGVAFRRSRVARWTALLGAVGVGAALALVILRSDEAAVSSYLFAACVFLLGTVAMATALLAAIPQTRGAALGGLAAGGVLIGAFVLTYYVAFNLGVQHWIQRPPGALARTGFSSLR